MVQVVQLRMKLKFVKQRGIDRMFQFMAANANRMSYNQLCQIKKKKKKKHRM